MKAEIISIGDELLIGQVVNTNASWIAEQLNLAGIGVVRINTIADLQEEIISALDEAKGRADIILLTGGLGPTKDDITKNTLCHYFNTQLVFDQASFDNIVRLFGHRGYPITGINKAQAELPASCTPVMNLQGTAPGMWFEEGGKTIISMPGVPFEMKAMMQDHIIPALSKRKNGQYVVYRVVLTQGVGESFLSEKISSWEDSLPHNLKLAYLPQPGIVRLRITGSGPDKDLLKEAIDQEVEKLNVLIPELIFGYGDETLEEIVGQLLMQAGSTLSTAESCTGGYIAHLITSVAGSSAYFQGSVVAYHNDVKMGLLGVAEQTLIDHGAVSEQTVREMAEGAQKRFGTDYAIAVSGVAGPGGGTDSKPVGTTWIAIAGKQTIYSKKFIFGNNRQRNIRLAAVTALNRLRQMIEKEQ